MISAKPVFPKHRTILPKAVRYFNRNGFRLSNSGKNLGKGATVILGPIVVLQYDHWDKEATAFIMNGHEYYLIVDEIQLAGLREELVKLKQRPPLVSITTEGDSDREIVHSDSAAVRPLLRLLR